LTHFGCPEGSNSRLLDLPLYASISTRSATPSWRRTGSRSSGSI